MENYHRQISPGTTIQLRKPKFMERKYELAIGEEVVGTILMPKAFGKLAYVSAGKEEWSLERKGFWKRYMVLKKKDQETELLRMSIGGMNRKLLHFNTPKGEVYDLVREGFWGAYWTWKKNDTVLMRLHTKLGWKNTGDITLEHNDPMETILLLAGTYAIIMNTREEAATTAAVTATVG